MDLNKPKPFNPNKNQIGKDWQRWKKEFFIYMRLSGTYESCSEEERALLLINLMGTEAIKAMEDMSFDDPDKKNDMDILIKKFDEIFDPPLNEVVERYKFFSRTKGQNENIDSYVTDLKVSINAVLKNHCSSSFVIYNQSLNVLLGYRKKLLDVILVHNQKNLL